MARMCKIALVTGLVATAVVAVMCRFYFGHEEGGSSETFCCSGAVANGVQHPILTQRQAITRATEEYRRRGRLTGAELKNVRISACQSDDGGWLLVVWYLPATPGQFTIIRIDKKGCITTFLDGDA
jgi:hypothetical protein